MTASAPSGRAQSGFTRPGAAARYDYARRRAALRASWFPGSAAALAAEEARGVVLRFVVGRAAGAGQEAALADEERAHGDFLRLDLQARRRGPPGAPARTALAHPGGQAPGIGVSLSVSAPVMGPTASRLAVKVDNADQRRRRTWAWRTKRWRSYARCQLASTPSTSSRWTMTCTCAWTGCPRPRRSGRRAARARPGAGAGVAGAPSAAPHIAASRSPRTRWGDAAACNREFHFCYAQREVYAAEVLDTGGRYRVQVV